MFCEIDLYADVNMDSNKAFYNVEQLQFSTHEVEVSLAAGYKPGYPDSCFVSVKCIRVQGFLKS